MEYPFESLGPALHALALVLLFALAAAGIGVVVVLAALPGRIAAARRHPQAEAVNVCGWLGLLTGVGWVVALVWAYWRPARRGPVNAHDPQSVAAHLDRLESAVTAAERRTGVAR
ncbi:MAG: DUF3302 domain-containing protein [Planctomycetales bacterium]|nr:DUF3302 domain-containing protein [Planctomycetales bacterium]